MSGPSGSHGSGQRVRRVSVSTRQAGVEHGVRITSSGVKLTAIDSAPHMQVRHSPSLLAIAAFLLTAPAVAQMPQPSTSYAPVAITLPAPSADLSFAAFRAAIAA